jgi:hypothetical protein
MNAMWLVALASSGAVAATGSLSAIQPIETKATSGKE